MNPFEIKTDSYKFRLDSHGWVNIDEPNPPCPSESGFRADITLPVKRVELARFLREAADKLATPPKQSKSLEAILQRALDEFKRLDGSQMGVAIDRNVLRDLQRVLDKL